MAQLSLPLTTVFLFGLISAGLAIRCYKCNSEKDGDACLNLSPETSDQFLVDCEVQEINGVNMTDVLCRKMNIYLDQSYTKKNFAHDRVQRDCGYVEDKHLWRKGNCYYRSGYNTRTWACSCGEDECNTAPGQTATWAGLVASLLTTLFVLRV